MLIRAATPQDAGACLAIYAPHVSAGATSFEEVPPTVDEFALRIRRILRTHAFLVAEADGELTAFAYAGPYRERPAYRWSAEVSVYVAARHHRKGVAKGLYRTLFALLEQQGYRQLLAAVALPNPASIRLHHSLGFADVGVFCNVGWKAGAWRDVAWLQRPLGRPPTETSAPPSPGAPVRLSGPVEI